MDKSEPVAIAGVWTEAEASVIKSLLESCGIPCHYTSGLPGRLYPPPAESPGPIRLYVPGPLAKEAESILAEHQDQLEQLRPLAD